METSIPETQAQPAPEAATTDVPASVPAPAAPVAASLGLAESAAPVASTSSDAALPAAVEASAASPPHAAPATSSSPPAAAASQSPPSNLEHSPAEISAAILKLTRSSQEGDALLAELKGFSSARDVGARLGLPGSISGAALAEAYKLCSPTWHSNVEGDIQSIVDYIFEESANTMAADRHFRVLQGKIGRRMLGRGVLTVDVLNAAQSRYHAYWSKVTPGNVGFLVKSVIMKSANWAAADRKFDWLWKKGEWSENRTVKLAGREFTAEDLEQAERDVRRKFGESLKLVVRRPGEGKKEGDEAGEKGDGTAKDNTPKKDGKEKEKEKDTSKESNVDLIFRRVLSKCDGVEKAERFFKMLSSNVGTPNPTGRTFTKEDVDEAWNKVKHHFQTVVESDSSDSDSSTSSDEDEKAKRKAKKQAKKEKKERKAKKEKKEKAGAGSRGKARAEENKHLPNVDFIIDHVMHRFKTFPKAEKFFDTLYQYVDKPSPIGRTFSNQEVKDAFVECKRRYEAPDAKGSKFRRMKSAKTSKQQEKDSMRNTDYIVRKAGKCRTLAQATKLFEVLRSSIGKKNALGNDRTFTEQEVNDAETRCGGLLEELKNKPDDPRAAEEDAASSSESSGERPSKAAKTRDAKRKDKMKKMKSKGLVDDELENVFFGSDSDDMSGETSVDEEAEDAAMDLGDFENEGEVGEDVMEDSYPAEEWAKESPEILPGLQGFNLRATTIMNRAQVGKTKLEVTFDAHAACPPLQPHQESVAFLVHPKSPVSRMLVDHPTGSGKTREMIRVLENFFFDPRPKVPIFPKDPVCRNFYTELLRWPSRYRDYFCCERPKDAVVASGKPDWREVRFHMWDMSGFAEEEVRRLGYSIREVLEMKAMFYMGKVRKSLRRAFHKKHPGESMPVAPLRAIGYTSAGGAYSTFTENGWPLSAMMKVGFEKGGKNVYTNKVVLMDEAHNLVRTHTQYAEQLQRLRNLLFTAKNLVLVGFTGTPILNEPTEGRQLLDIIKGMGAPEGDEGFLSSFPMRPQPLFPLSLPRGVPDSVLTMARKRQLIKKIELRGESLKVYDIKRRLGVPARRLRAYCNVCTFHSSFHEGRSGTKIKVLTFPEEMCPKLYAIAQAVCSSTEKAIIMTGRMSGHIVMLELMRYLAAKADPPFAVATMDELAEFNHVSNLRGENYRVMVADAAQCSEGVSFLAVRRTFLADVPVSPSAFIQQCGRAIRMYGHRGLPEEEQTVTNNLYVATLPKWMRSSTLSTWSFRAQKKHSNGKDMEKRARILTARLNRAGIKNLAELKRRIDEHGAAKQEMLQKNNILPLDAVNQKVQLTAEDIAAFLDNNGLWEEARLLRAADRKTKELQDATAAGKDALIKSIDEDTSAIGEGGAKLLHLKTMASFDSLDRTQSMEDLDGDLGGGDSLLDLEGELEKALNEDSQPGDAPEGTTQPMEESQPAEADAVPSQQAAAPQAEDHKTNDETKLEAERALSESISVMKLVCKEIDKPSTNKAEGEGEGEKISWRHTLQDGLKLTRFSPPVAAALKMAVGPEFDTENSDLSRLSIEQVKSLRDELVKMERVAIIQYALKVLKEVKGMMSTSTAVPDMGSLGRTDSLVSMNSMDLETVNNNVAAEVAAAAAPAPIADAPAVAAAPLADAAAAPAVLAAPATAATPAVADATTAASEAQQTDNPQAAADSDVPMAPAESAPAPMAGGNIPPPPPLLPPPPPPPPAESAPAAPVEGTTDEKPPAEAEADAGVAAGERFVPKVEEAPRELTPEEAANAILQAQVEAQNKLWRAKLAEGFKELRTNEHIRVALKVSAPGLLDPTDEGLSTITAESVARLQHELSRLQEQAEKGGSKPRALVRAMQMLYLSSSADDSTMLLSTDSADEEALRQLTERTEEFAPALAAMRQLAVDREIFDHLAEKLVEDDIIDHSESEGSDLEAELLGRKEGPPIVLPPGWRLEWVKRKKKEVREYVDPWERRYYSTKEVRQALEDWEATQAHIRRLEEQKKAREEAIQAAAAAGLPPPPSPTRQARRTRLRGKASVAFETPQEASGDVAEVVEDDAAEVVDDLDPPSSAAPAAPAAPAASSRQEAVDNLDDLDDMGMEDLEAAFEEALDDAFGEEAEANLFEEEKPPAEVHRDTAAAAPSETHSQRSVEAPAAERAAGAAAAAAASGPSVVAAEAAPEQLQPEEGAKIRLKGLVAIPQLNGQEGKLNSFNEDNGRWECELDFDQSLVNVKPANFDVLAPAPQQGRKRKAAGKAAGRQVRAKAAGAPAGAGSPGNPGGAPRRRKMRAPKMVPMINQPMTAGNTVEGGSDSD